MSNLRDAKPRVKTITLNDGVEREIKFTLNALAELEDKYGSVDAAFAAMDNGSIKATRFVLWAGLMHDEENGLTEKQVGNLIDMACLKNIMSSLAESLGEDMPQPDSTGVQQVPNA